MNNTTTSAITDFIFVKDELEKSDVIFIPGGSAPELGEQAAELCKRGLAQFVIPSGAVSLKTNEFGGVKSKREIYNKDYLTECEFLTDVLQINGVPREAIICEDKSGYTKQNAEFSARAAAEAGIAVRKAILCCKSYHARRALMCYQHAFPNTEIFVYPIPYRADDVEISAENWHESEAGIQRVLGELERCGTQFYNEFLSAAKRGFNTQNK